MYVSVDSLYCIHETNMVNYTSILKVKNFKTAAIEHHTKHGVLLGAGSYVTRARRLCAREIGPVGDSGLPKEKDQS